MEIFLNQGFYQLFNKLFIILIDIFATGLILWVYFAGPRQKINQLFTFFAISILLWVNAGYFLNFSQDQSTALFWAKFAPSMVFIFLIAFYFFSLYFPREQEEKYLILNKVIPIIGLSLSFLTFFSNFIIQDIEFTKWGVNPVFTLHGKPLFYGIVIIFTFLISFLLIKKNIRLEINERLKIQYFLIGLFIFVLMNLIFNVAFPLWRGTIQYWQFGNYSAIFLLGFTAYAIVKRELFGIRVVLTALFVGIIAILLFLNAFVLTKELPLKIIQGVILAIFLIFGYSLIQSVLREIKYREQLQQAYLKLQELDRAKSEFISIASHQLRTPLTAIKGYISMLLEGTYGGFAEKAKTPLENVYKSSERLIKLVNDLLSISKIEAGKMELEIEKASLEDIIREVIEEFKVEAEKKKIYLKWERPQRPLPSIFVDIDKIRQVILNMVDNAIRYTNKGGITIISEVKNLDIEIRISDTGEGMTRDEISKIFESFSRGGAGSRFYTEGVGLGLYVAKKFVEMHKGRIWAESQGKGKGSNFYIQLPISQETIEDIIKTM